MIASIEEVNIPEVAALNTQAFSSKEKTAERLRGHTLDAFGKNRLKSEQSRICYCTDLKNRLERKSTKLQSFGTFNFLKVD